MQPLSRPDARLHLQKRAVKEEKEPSHPMSEDTLLLTPFIAPPERELKKALLLSDRISTIASPAYRPTAALAELESRGWWVPAYLGDL